MLTGMKIKLLKRFPDERGIFTEIFRKDWPDLLDEKDEIVQSNLSTTYPNVIRAWHRHEKGQTDYFVVIKGALRICAYNEVTRELDEIVSTGENLQVVKVPGHYWHGFKVVGNEPALLVYFTTRLYDAAQPDEERRQWDDKTLTPSSINGKKDDPRVGKSWNWNYPPHK
jgi:dTDP-4-dehydrorhamnose 3,5-epimerase